MSQLFSQFSENLMILSSSDPTKMDNDVLKALHNVEINRHLFPNVFCWYNALMKFTLEERSRYIDHLYHAKLKILIMNISLILLFPHIYDSFPQPVVGRTVNSPAKPTSPFVRTPLKDLIPKINTFQLKPSKLTY